MYLRKYDILTNHGDNRDEKYFNRTGRITLIDFWASWCGPCRKEIPHVKKYYEEYKNKGVQFISVSIDAKKDAWTKALKEEQMPWLQGWAEFR